MARFKDQNWSIPGSYDGIAGLNTQHAMLSVLMDIRDELKSLNSKSEFIRENTLAVKSTLSCSNFQRVPRILERISANTAKPRKKKPARKKVRSS